MALFELSNILIGHAAVGLRLIPHWKELQARFGTVQEFRFSGSTNPGKPVPVRKMIIDLACSQGR